MPLQLSTVMIGVEDLARSKKFYAEGLGCIIDKDYPGFVQLNLGEGCSPLALYEREAAAQDAGVSSEGSGFRGVSFHYIVPVQSTCGRGNGQRHRRRRQRRKRSSCRPVGRVLRLLQRPGRVSVEGHFICLDAVLRWSAIGLGHRPGSAAYRTRLVELNPVAGRVNHKGLDARPRRHRVSDFEALLSQLGDDRREVSESQGEVLAHVLWRLRLDEVDLLATRVEPGPAEGESGSVRTDLEAEHVNIERHRRVQVVHVDRYVMEANRLHGLDYGTLTPTVLKKTGQVGGRMGGSLLELNGCDADRVLARVLERVCGGPVAPLERWDDRRRVGGPRVVHHRPRLVPADEVATAAGDHQVLGQVGVQRRLLPDPDDRLDHTDVVVLEHHCVVGRVRNRPVQIVFRNLRHGRGCYRRRRTPQVLDGGVLDGGVLDGVRRHGGHRPVMRWQHA